MAGGGWERLRHASAVASGLALSESLLDRTYRVLDDYRGVPDKTNGLCKHDK